MDREPVAIIGLALALPGADDLRSLHENLWHGRAGIAPPGPARAQGTGGHPAGGYLDRVDLFDHAFFGLSRGEAEAMDPPQRLSLTLVHQAIENACYAPRSLRGSNTAVIVSAPGRDETGTPAADDPQTILGTLPAAAAGRIAYLFDLTGPALAVDTACSGSLAALSLAVGLLRAGQAGLAIAGGISVRPMTPRPAGEPLRGIESPDGVCRPFDAAANGTVGGEGGGFVVLKPLARALGDRDVIHAVIRGVAVNQNGFRATGMSAPSRPAQTEVIRAAWADGGIDPATIGYVECHGSGTELGDLVEVDGLLRAFADAGGDPVEIGTIKANIGHLDHAAGIAGLFKAVAGLRHCALYPTPRFERPNTLLAGTDVIRVSGTARSWKGTDCSRARAGLSSYGLTGTNVHAVLEQAPDPEAPDRPPDDRAHLVTVSARSPAAFARYTRLLAGFVERTEHGLPEIAHALNRGRDDHPYRWAGIAARKEELALALSTAQPLESPAARPTPVVMVFPGDARLDDAAWARLRAAFPALGTDEDADEGADDDEADTPGGRLFHRQYALCRLLRSLGLTESGLVGSGPGNFVVRAAREQLPLRQARSAAAASAPTPAVDAHGLERAVEGFARDGTVLVAMGSGTLTEQIARLAPDLRMVHPFGDGPLEALGRLYELGAAIDWERHYERADLRRVEVPTYPFEPVSCAPETARVPPSPPPGEDDVAEHVAAIWAEVLKSGPVAPAADYFELGGTSIAGIRVLHEVERRFGTRLTFTDLYEHRTVSSLAAAIRQRRAAGTGQADWSIPRVPRGGRLPLSFNQEQLWYLDRLNPGGSLYNIPAALRYRGPLDLPAFERAMRDVIDRHEVLRTRVADEDGVPYALADVTPRLKVADLRSFPETERETRAAQLARLEARTPFDLARGPLFRVLLVELADEEHLLLYTWHHIVFDGWSPSVFFADLNEAYTARLLGRAPDLAPLPVQYADFAAWQRARLGGERLARGLRFWRTALADAPRLEPPLDRPRGQVESHAGDLIEFALDAGLAQRLRDFSGQQGVTTFVTMLAVLDALMYLWTGQEDLVVGAVTSGRTNPATHAMVGYFNNALPFRTSVRADLGFRELVARCAVTVAGVLDHEEIPLSKIVADLAPDRDPARHPLFTVGYSHQNAPAHEAELAGLGPPSNGLAGTGIPPGASKVDLTFGVSDEGAGPMIAYLEYAVDLFDVGTARQLARLFHDLAAAAMADGERRVDELLPGWPRNRTGPAVLSGPSRRAGGRTLREAIEAHVAARPEHPAVVGDMGSGAGVHTYRDVDRMANRLAHRLAEAGTGAECPVPVVAERGVGLVAAWLAVIKAGAAFVPLDPAAPSARLESILARLDAPVLLTDEYSASLAAPGRRLLIEETGAGPGGDTGPPAATAPHSLAYIAYTSGSTGRPHGCAIEHRGLLNVVEWYGEAARLSPGDRVTQLFSPGFDAAIMETLGTLYHGATLHIGDPLRTPAALLRWIAERRITVAAVPAPLAELILAEPLAAARTSLRALLSGGDRLRARPPLGAPFRVLNVYGPTECTVSATYEEVTAATTGELPGIGTPITGVSAYIVDKTGRAVRRGEAGELCLGGVGVGRGYHGDSALTAARFVADPFAAQPGARMYRTGDLARLRRNGTIEFLGRGDDQIQIRGHRVEPAEVEQAFLAHPAVTEAAVIAETGLGGTPRLVAHVAGDQAPDEAELLAFAARELPEWMLPARVTRHARLPMTSTWKIDRRALQGRETPMSTVRPETTVAEAPAGDRREAESLIAGIMADLLGRDHLAADEGFFALGGDSILSVALASRAARAGLEITPQDVLRHQTPRALATAAVAARGLAPSPPARRRIPLTPLMHGMLEHSSNDSPDDAADFVTAEVLEVAPGVRAGDLRTALAHLVEAHETLRYRLRRNSLGRWFECAAAESADLLDTKVLPPLDEEGRLAVLEADKDELVAGLDVTRGPLIRGRFYDRGPNRPGTLVLAVHHFAYDHISAVPMLEDLNRALTDIATLGAPSAERRPPAWREWAGHLTGMAQSDELAGEVAYWTAVLTAGAPHVTPPGDTGGAGGSAEPGMMTRVLEADQVAPVLRTSGPAGRAAATCAVACAVARWSGGEDAYVMVVGQGTPNAYRPADRSLSIGWFTSAYPALLRVGTGADVPGALSGVAETLDAVPNDGVGYGILRHLSPGSAATLRLRSLPEPRVLVEHTASGGDAIDLSSGPVSIRSTPLAIGHRSLLAYLPIAISSVVQGDRLLIHLAHHAACPAGTMDALAGHLADTFAELAGGG